MNRRRVRRPRPLALALLVVTGACTVTTGRSLPTPSTVVPATTVPAGPAVVSDATAATTWRRLPLGAGGFVTGLVVHSSGRLYARTDVGGAYRYDRTSRTWTQMLVAGAVPDDVAHPYNVESIAVAPSNPDILLVSVGDDPNPGSDSDPLPTTGRVLRSTDGGRTWAASATAFFISGNAEHRQRAERLAIDPADPAHVLLGTRRQGLWESTDGGATFRQVPVGSVPIGRAPRPEVDHAGVTFVTFDPTARRVYAGVAGAGVYRRDDAVAPWRRIIEARSASDVPFEGTLTAGRLLVTMSIVEGDGDATLGLYDPVADRVRDLAPGGRTSAYSAAIDPADPDHVVVTEAAARSGHFWRSTDGGATWRTLDVAIDASTIPWLDRTDLASFMSVGRLVFDPTVRGRLWFAEGMGVWRTDDFVDTKTARDRVTFTLDSTGIEELVIADVVTPPGGSPVVVAADRQGFLVRDLTAFPKRTLVDPSFVGGTDVDYSGGAPGELVWIGAEYHRYFDPARRARGAVSHDGGTTWTELPNLTKDMFGGNVAMSAGDPRNIVWLPSYFLSPFEHLNEPKALFVTTDAGAHWREVIVDGRANYHRLLWWLGRQALVADKVERGVFYLQSDTEDFEVSTDGGLTWRRAAHSAPCTEALTCHVYGQLVASPTTAGEVWSAAGDAGLYRTTDRGASPWTRVAGVDAVRSMGLGASLRAGGPPAIYLYGRVNGDAALGIWVSGDDGASWELLGRTPLGLLTGITSVTGDPNVPGRVYVGFGGNGVVYGDLAR